MTILCIKTNWELLLGAPNLQLPSTPDICFAFVKVYWLSHVFHEDKCAVEVLVYAAAPGYIFVQLFRANYLLQDKNCYRHMLSNHVMELQPVWKDYSDKASAFSLMFNLLLTKITTPKFPHQFFLRTLWIWLYWLTLHHHPYMSDSKATALDCSSYQNTSIREPMVEGKQLQWESEGAGVSSPRGPQL